LATNKPAAELPQHPLVDRMKPDPAQVAKKVVTLVGLPGKSDRSGYQRLYLTGKLDYYAEFLVSAMVHSATVPPEQSPIAGQEATSVSLARDATIHYVWASTAQPIDEFDLDVRLGAQRAAPAVFAMQNTQAQTACETCFDSCAGSCATCNSCEANTCAGNTCVTCVNTCNTCATQCNQQTCANTCNTCQTQCNQQTCNTCQTQCDQQTCNTCQTQCDQPTCVGTQCNQHTCQTCHTRCGTCGGDTCNRTCQTCVETCRC
jgi:hypothetical protein